MPYNVLRDARSIRNSFLCVHDSLDKYSSDFHTNGNVDGWTVYNNIYLYGCWNGVLFGTSYDRSCYVSRTNVFQYVEAEKYYYLKIMMKVTNNNPDKVVQGLTQGRVQWSRLGDSSWDTNKQYDFDIIADDKWRLYVVNLGPAQWWQGNINNLRVYPFIDGWKGDSFAIKYIKISSVDSYACSNTQCSYYLNYSHPCPGAGVRGSCEAGTGKTIYTTTSGVNDRLLVNIDGYGEEAFRLGDNQNFTGTEMAKVIASRVSSLKIGGYAYCECLWNDVTHKLKLTSGTAGNRSEVEIGNSPAAIVLGFDTSTKVMGTTPATGFDYASSRLLTASEINKLTDGSTDSYAYIHNPDQYNLEGGRRDFNEVGTNFLLSDALANNYYQSLNNSGRTIIEMSHPINNNGRLKAVYLYGKIDSLSKVKICRPHSDGTLEVVYSVNLPTDDPTKLYTSIPLVYRVDCDLLVNKGDLLAIYNADLYVGKTTSGLPDAIFCQVNGEVSGRFDPGAPYSFGVGGFAIYARGDRQQSGFMLDIDLGDRVNIENFNIYGVEESSYLEMNIAACLDLSWQVNLFGENHIHTGTNWLDGTPFTDIHTNIAYGTTCLDDCVTTADNGQFTLTTSYMGLATTGAHAYFYVNGDAEWLYAYSGGKSEYSWARVPAGTYGYTTDPIAFILYFPYNFSTKIFRSRMYFKEKDSFRNLALSTYLGPYYTDGNADDAHFQYIPGYTSIRMDGILFEPDDGSTVNPYIFDNPMSDILQYDSNGKAINWEDWDAANYARWNVLEHNFDDIECYGFRIYTNNHLSTKITELELYSRVYTEPSLVDNVFLTFSDYGEVWKIATFTEPATNKLSAFIGGAPRYISLQFESSNRFTLNELECLTNDDVRLEDCSDSVYLEDAKSGVTNEATPITLINVYDKPFDLLVDLPKETTESSDLIFWSKMGSYEEIESPEIGPSCILFKSADKSLVNDNNQCAINIPTYGLKNLVDDKIAYYSYNDSTWDEYGVLSSGVSIDFCNSNYRKSVLSFPAHSEEYWKVGVTVTGSSNRLYDVLSFYNSDRVNVRNMYVNSVSGIYAQTTELDSNGIDIYPPITLLSGVTNVFGFKVDSGVYGINKIVFIHTSGATFFTYNLRVSNNNLDNYTAVSGVTITQSNATYNMNFAVDLEKRHDLDIVRNYGVATNKMWTSITSNVVYSNTNTSNIDSVIWGNTTYNDARWLRIALLAGDGTVRCLRKLGIYPDISSMFCISGGYNCEWESLGNVLSDYESSINVAFGATVTGTNCYANNFYPFNAVDGVNTSYRMDACWGFQTVSGVVPYFELDFGGEYTIYKMILYHGYDPGDSSYMNTSFSGSYSATTSGSFVSLFSAVGNSSFTTTHQFTPVSARRVRLTMTGWNSGNAMFVDEYGNYDRFTGSFLREIEIYTYTDTGYVDSETWPVVCMNLQDQFVVVGHDVVNKDVTSTTTNWDNNESFFRYSDNILDEPQKVAFTTQGQYVIQYSSNATSGDQQGNYEYNFTTSTGVYFDAGYYEVTWEAYHANLTDEVSLQFSGPEIVDFYASNLSTTWTAQSGSISIPQAGYYAVKAVQHLDIGNNWGARYPLVRRPYGYTKWVSVKRDTATNYSYDNDSGKYGIDYLSLLKVYGNTKYNPTEFSWWWRSLISELSEDYLVVISGSRSLKIEYPVSSGTDIVTFIEGDDWGQDINFSSKDLFQFNWYINDVAKLDTDFGYVLLGNRYVTDPAYYVWNIKNIDLSTGWNSVELKFEDADLFYPASDESISYAGFLQTQLDFRNNGKDCTSFALAYRGVGESFSMNLDTLNIKRNVFEDGVKFGKGLCLNGYDYLEIPLSDVNLERGTIEFWMKPYTDSYGRDVYQNLASRVLFTIVNNNNDIVSLGIKSGNWFEPVLGNIRHAVNSFYIDELDLPASAYFVMNEVIHVAFVWSNDGRFMDNEDTVRLYLNGELICAGRTAWEVGDTKSAMLKLGGATAQMAHNFDAYGATIYDNVKVYNFCKTEFNTMEEGVSKDISYTPNQFLEISDDNVNFYGVGSPELPLIFPLVPVGESKTIWVRANKNEHFKQSKLTGQLSVEWVVTV